MKTGFVGVVGRPNVGKSTFINLVVGQKVSIVSSVPQTTRYLIRGIYTDSRGQIIFIDTPGFYKPQHDMAKRMSRFLELARKDADVILYMTDATRNVGEEELKIMEKLLNQTKPVIMAINKIDKGLKFLDEYVKTWQELSKKVDRNPLKYFIPISCIQAKNTDKVIEAIFEFLPAGEPFYSSDTKTDFPQQMFIEEIIREKLFSYLKEEIPHSLAVKLEDVKFEKNMVYLYCTIYVERDSQKKIVIGKEGNVLKKIGIESRKELEVLLNKKVVLKLWVKTKPDWRNRPDFLKELGF